MSNEIPRNRTLAAGMNRRGTGPSRSRGAALVIALLVMGALLLLGTTFLTISTTETTIAINARDATQAFFAASTGLTRLERDLVAQFEVPYRFNRTGNCPSSLPDLTSTNLITGEPFGVSGETGDANSLLSCVPSRTAGYYTLPGSPTGSAWVTVPYVGGTTIGAYQYLVQVRNATASSAAYPTPPNTIEVQVTANASAGPSMTGATRQIQARLQVDQLVPANYALFIDGGVWRLGSTGTMIFAGSVYTNGTGSSPTSPAIALGSGGTADQIVNYYKGIDATLQGGIAALPLKTNPITGETSQGTLDTVLRVNQGAVQISSGSASVGEANVSNNGVKETLNGVYTNQGFTGTPGAANVYSDNGAGTGFDLPRELTPFPDLTGAYTGAPLPSGSPTPASHDAYLQGNSLAITGSISIDSRTDNFSYPAGLTDLSQCTSACFIYRGPAGGNPATLMVNGIVWVKGGDITLGGVGLNRLSAIRYQGSGTLYARSSASSSPWGTIEVTSDLFPVAGSTFPTTASLGLISGGSVTVGDWTSWWSNPTLRIAATIFANSYMNYNFAPYQIAGSVTSRYFYSWLGARIYAVPALGGMCGSAPCRPIGMPGVRPAKGGSPYFVRTLSWRDVTP